MTKSKAHKKPVAAQEIKVHLNQSASSVLFSDIVQIETSADNVVINFMQKFPPSHEVVNAQIVSRIALSWPHLIRLEKLLSDTISKHSGNALSSLEDALKKSSS